MKLPASPQQARCTIVRQSLKCGSWNPPKSAPEKYTKRNINGAEMCMSNRQFESKKCQVQMSIINRKVDRLNSQFLGSPSLKFSKSNAALFLKKPVMIYHINKSSEDLKLELEIVRNRMSILINNFHHEDRIFAVTY
jgi:hypothetical protein